MGFRSWFEILPVANNPEERKGATGSVAVAAVNEADDVDLRLIVLRDRSMRNIEGDPEGTLRMFYVGRLDSVRVGDASRGALRNATNPSIK